jgi:polyferredoxin
MARAAHLKMGALPSQRDRLRLLRPRTYYYSLILLVVIALMLSALLMRTPFDLHVLHERNPLFVKLSAGGIRNNYTIKILNKTREDHQFALTLEGIPEALLTVEGAGIPDPSHLDVLADSIGQFRVHVVLPGTATPLSRRDIRFMATDNLTHVTEATNSMFVTGEP